MHRERSGVVARVNRSFGRNGELLISLYDSFPEDFDLQEPLFVDIDKLAVPLFCDRFERRGSGALVVFADFDSPQRTSLLLGCELFLESGNEISLSDVQGASESEPDPDAEELCPEDLVGFTAVIGPSLQGVIEEYIDGENPLFIVLAEGREIYIPVADEMITEIDVRKCTIWFDLPEGLLELNG